jgi:transposase
MYVCILDSKGKVKVHKNIKTHPEVFFELIFPYLDDIAVGVECVFCWYWLADLCAEHHIRFVLGHALYMKAIHGGKTKNDRIDSYKLASLLKGGNFPIAYAYPAKWRATRDLLRRRMYVSRRCGELVAHIINTNTQYNLPAFKKNCRENTITTVWQSALKILRYAKAFKSILPWSNSWIDCSTSLSIILKKPPASMITIPFTY